MAYNTEMHGALVVLEGEEGPLLSPSNQRKLQIWESEFKRDKRKCNYLRFVPASRQFYEGGVSVVLWPGRTLHNTANGVPHVTPSDYLQISKDGYCPRSREEAIRLLILCQNHQNRICLYEDRELEPEAKSAEKALAKEREDHARTRAQLDDLREKLAKQEKKA